MIKIVEIFIIMCYNLINISVTQLDPEVFYAKDRFNRRI